MLIAVWSKGESLQGAAWWASTKQLHGWVQARKAGRRPCWRIDPRTQGIRCSPRLPQEGAQRWGTQRLRLGAVGCLDAAKRVNSLVVCRSGSALWYRSGVVQWCLYAAWDRIARVCPYCRPRPRQVGGAGWLPKALLGSSVMSWEKNGD